MKSREEFARFLNLVEKIRHDIEKDCGCPVYKEPFEKNPGYHLYKHEGYPKYVFAQIRPRVRFKCKIYTKEEWASKAEVEDTKDGRHRNGYYRKGEASIYWDIKETDDERYKEIIRALSKICQVR